MVVFPNIKVNIGLRVVRKRSDGYHDIESIFYPVPLQDVLEMVPSGDDDFRLTIEGAEIPPGGTNTIEKAWQIVKEEYDIPGVHAAVLKHIPAGAGLGGGSSNGAFALRLLNDLFELQLSTERMEEFALRIGSDCPFFIRNQPAWVTGRGEQMETVQELLSGYHILLVNPGIHVGTAEAYGTLTPKDPGSDLLSLYLNSPIEEWRDSVINDFEAGIFPRHPRIGQIKEELYERGAVFASMSGSGSTVFGLFREEPHTNGFHTCFVWKGSL